MHHIILYCELLDWLRIEVCQNYVFSKIDITMTTINKKPLKSIIPSFARSRPATENPTPGTFKWGV